MKSLKAKRKKYYRGGGFSVEVTTLFMYETASTLFFKSFQKSETN